MEQKEYRSSIFNSGLKRKTLLIVASIITAGVVIQFVLSVFFLNMAHTKKIDFVNQGLDTTIKSAVETIIGALEANHRLFSDGLIDEKTAVESAARIVRETRYGSSDSAADDGYFWADTADGLCAVHPNPEYENVMRWEMQDQESTYFIQNFIKLGDEGGGYSEFYDPADRNNSSESTKKRGYTLKFEPYEWYISTEYSCKIIDNAIADFENTRYIYILVLLAVSILVIALGIFFVSLNCNRVTTPIIKISNRMHQLSMGDTSSEFSIDAKHDKYEIGELNKNVIKVAATLNKLVKIVSVVIDEHEQGNVDYSFDTNEFCGDYKILADNVLELASFGMKDQLTGIPNRRCFDKRIDLEWKRATRDKTNVSVLMLDVDKFKNYNDEFGHPQGDIALQAVANVILKSAKRSFDFAARWGGEEFVVLLPSTDSSGAIRVAEKIREEIANTIIPRDDGQESGVTVSIGISSQIPTPKSTIRGLIDKADAALYTAKKTGRNRVILG